MLKALFELPSMYLNSTSDYIIKNLSLDLILTRAFSVNVYCNTPTYDVWLCNCELMSDGHIFVNDTNSTFADNDSNKLVSVLVNVLKLFRIGQHEPNLMKTST